METSKNKICPLLKDRDCIENSCAFWCDFAQDCSVPLLAGMFADSSVCKTVFGVPLKCKFCEEKKRATVNEKGFLICPASGMEITDDDYCSYFEAER